MVVKSTNSKLRFPKMKTDGKHHPIPTFWHFVTPKSQSFRKFHPWPNPSTRRQDVLSKQTQLPNSTPSIKNDTQDSSEISIQTSPLKSFFPIFSTGEPFAESRAALAT